MVLHPHAKINLHLEVGRKRTDGFHEISSLIQEISISDDMTVSLSKAETCINVVGAEIGENNSLERAICAFKKITGFEFALNVSLIKRIPIGAGLGGASSDAASLILAMNDLLKANLGYDEMLKIALEVGSDVPFFLTGGTYIGLLVYPEFQSFTKEAYEMLDSLQEKKEMWFDLDNASLFGCGFFNSFEKPLFERYPVLQEIKNDFLTFASDFSLMSGSGSSVYGLFHNWEEARGVQVLFSKKWSNCNFFIPIEK